MTTHHQILIVGGGNAGISVAAQLHRADKNLEIAIIDPSEKHYYQPAWTLVGAGIFKQEDTIRDEKDVIPEYTTWIKEAATSFQPEQNKLQTANGNEYTYDVLIAAPGIQLDWHKVKGLKETLGKNGVTSNYAFEYTNYTYECLQSIKDGQTALFTSPGTPVKCGGAPQKIMYLAGDYFRKNKIKAAIEFTSAGSVIFGIKKYADELMKMINRYGIQLSFKHELVAINGTTQTATFEVTAADGTKTEVTKSFDMIHVVPPQSAPDFIKSSPLADANGWIDVDKFSLQHKKFPNIFALGDATNTPNAKTGAAVRKQAPVLVKNLLAFMKKEQLTAAYNGYGSCPLVVGYNKLILAEFGYDNKIMETFPFDQSKPRWTMYLLKRFVLPWLYWNKILKGQM
jgi:sulfide:quinone oxidoreductase